MAGKKIEVRQTRSANRTSPNQIATLHALGLGRIGKKKVHKLSAPTVGMIKVVQHLVTLSEVK